MVFQGDIAPLTTWLLYVELALVVGCGIIWGFKLTECLVLFDPLLILPLMVGTYILFGGIAGGIFFQEFEDLGDGMAGLVGGWILYTLGIVFVILGLYVIAKAADALDDSSKSAQPDYPKLDVTQQSSSLALGTEDEPSVRMANGVGEANGNGEEEEHGEEIPTGEGASGVIGSKTTRVQVGTLIELKKST